MNKRTLLFALVLLSAVCAYASTVTIVYPTPVEGLDSHLANTTTAHDTANTNATLASHTSSLATLSADVITRAGINGSTTQNFSVATLTASNIDNVVVDAVAIAVAQSVATNTVIIATFSSELIDSHSAFAVASGVFTAPQTGVYLVEAAQHYSVVIVGPYFSAIEEVYIYKNGAEYAREYQSFGHGDTGSLTVYRTPQICRAIPMVSGDTLDVRFLLQGAGSGLPNRASLGGTKGSRITITKVR